MNISLQSKISVNPGYEKPIHKYETDKLQYPLSIEVILLKVCPHCQFENFISYDVCDKCGLELTEEKSPTLDDDPDAPSEINTYLTEAILTTIFCFSPIGIVAIIYAVKAKSRIEAGDMQGAIEYSNKARNWYWIALGVSLTFLFLYIFIKENFLK